jgi:short-subunit dehydrogenase
MSDRPVGVVTGASRGLGFLLARELADRGHDVVINARSASGLDAAAGELQQRGAEVVTVAGDVADPTVGQELVDAAIGRFGRLDVLVANAGSIQVGPVGAMRAENFAEAMDLMFYGVLHPVLAALPVMRERGSGRILVITSIGGKLPAPHLLPYVAAKHAAVGFAEGLRVEAIRHGITVTCATPGLMRTGSPKNALFTGNQAAEYRWFTLADSLPLLSMDAARAAEQMVRAALKGKPEVAPTPLAKVGMRVHAVAPSTTLRVLGLVNRFPPTDETPRPLRPGWAVAKPSRWFDALTALTRRAAVNHHQDDDLVPDSARDAAGKPPE